MRRKTQSRIVLAFLAFAACAGSPLNDAQAQSCSREDVAAAVDDAGAALRQVTGELQPRVVERMAKLKQARGWSDEEAEEKFHAEMQDDQLALLERMANEQLERIDQLGVVPPNAIVECRRVEEIKAAGRDLQATVRARIEHLIARADAQTGGKAATQAAATPGQPAPAPPSAASGTAPAQPRVAVPQQPQVRPPAPTPAPAPQAQPPAAQPRPADPGWSTTTTVAVEPAEPTETYTIEEIKLASDGFFGKVSAGLGSIVEHAFSSAGRPAGYILGTESGGALIAGFRFGRGTLYLRNGETMQIFWHGPSIGTDIGASGSKVMFLVYRLRDIEQMFRPFTTLEGSAFLVGGVGFTLMTNGEVQTAPIRSGLGIRVGASVGYMRFTRRQTWNPF